MTELKCPFCQQELVKDTPFAWNCPNEECVETDMMWGTANMWQELIRIRKALEIAVDALKEISLNYQNGLDKPVAPAKWFSIATDMCDYADNAIEQITALE